MIGDDGNSVFVCQAADGQRKEKKERDHCLKVMLTITNLGFMVYLGSLKLTYFLC